MKYIIKNCPAIYINHNNEYDCDKAAYFCQDCTDCVMKQIVEKCKQEININDKDAPTNAYAMGRVVVAGKILELLEIEEVDEM